MWIRWSWLKDPVVIHHFFERRLVATLENVVNGVIMSKSRESIFFLNA